MVFLGVFATESEIKEMKDSASMPCIMVGGSWPESPQETCHRIALHHGLPEIDGYYGCDLRTGEFVKA